MGFFDEFNNVATPGGSSSFNEETGTYAAAPLAGSVNGNGQQVAGPNGQMGAYFQGTFMPGASASGATTSQTPQQQQQQQQFMLASMQAGASPAQSQQMWQQQFGGSSSTLPPGVSAPQGGSPSSGTWAPGQGSITAAQVSQQYGADPSVAQYWADKINTGGDPNYYIGRLSQDNAGTGPDGKGGVSGGGASGGSFSSGMTGTANLPALGSFGEVGVSGGGAPSFNSTNVPQFTAPAPFQAPTLAEAQNDPGYQFGLTQGSNTLQSSAAAKGMLLSGNTLKALDQYGTDYAATKYNDVYNRALQTYGTNFNNSLGAFNANTGASLGYGNLNNAQQQTANSYALGSANVALGNKQADQGYALGVGNLGLGYYSAGNNFALGQGQLALGYQNSNNQNAQAQANYGLNANAQQFYQNYAFPIGVGQQATSNTGQYGTNYANQGSNLITGAGNAQAAGTIGGANAYNSAYGTIGNNAMGAYYNNLYSSPYGTATTMPGVNTPITLPGS